MADTKMPRAEWTVPTLLALDAELGDVAVSVKLGAVSDSAPGSSPS